MRDFRSLRACSCVIALLGMVAAPSLADVPCTTLDRIVASAPDGFAAMRGRTLEQFDDYSASELNAFLPGAAICKLIELDDSARIDCLYHYENEQAAVDGGSMINAWIARCAGKRYFYEAGRYRGTEKKVIFSSRPAGRGDYRISILPANP